MCSPTSFKTWKNHVNASQKRQTRVENCTRCHRGKATETNRSTDKLKNDINDIDVKNAMTDLAITANTNAKVNSAEQEM